MKRTIIDFTTTEVVRGSFGYDSYLLYSAFKKMNPNDEIKLIEDATPMQVHKGNIETSDSWYIHYWSYPQKGMIDWSLENLKGDKSFIGYKPLILENKLKLSKEFNNETLYQGMLNLPHVLNEFRYGLMSDCDEHIKGSNMGEVKPLFLSYGCPNVCKFCPIPPNRKMENPRRLELSVDDCSSVLEDMRKLGYNNIHFCDEDFFMNTNRAEQLVNMLDDMKGFKYIALASIDSFDRLISRVGTKKLLSSGLQTVELGLETRDVNLRKEMRKTGNTNQLDSIVSNEDLKNKIFYLSVSLFPGETIESLRTTGEFLKLNGPNVDLISNRIRTNSTQGGLGQFFQPYCGSYGVEELKELGYMLEDVNRSRLSPSFVPFSFANQKPRQISTINENEEFWFKDVYNLDLDSLKKLELNGNKKVSEIIGKDKNKLKYILILSKLGKLKNGR